MRKLKLDSGDITTDQGEILKYQREFYKKLYSSERNDEIDYDAFLNDPSLPTLTEFQRQACEQDLTLEECHLSLKTFSKNKSPGTDGINVEFYDYFWRIIGQPLYQCFIYSFEHGELSNSQRQAIITLLEKPGKDRQQIKNWRPISLLNHDFKILTKALSLRIRKVLPDIIHHNQSGYVDGRYIGDSIRLVQDVMEIATIRNLPGMLLFIDFQKAFDTIEFDFILKAFEKFNFGRNIINWIQILYKNATSCVINNGISSCFFDVNRGVRQGDPLSPYIFILVIELLAHRIRSCEDIHGIKISNKEIKITLYADDITIVAGDRTSAKNVFKILNEFAMCSGLKINKDKSEAMWLGRDRNSTDTPFNILWPKTPIKLLGIYLSYDKGSAVKANFEDKIEKLKKLLHWWKSRDLSLIGRVLIAKTLGLSLFSHLSSMIHISKEYVTQINKIVYEFIWKGQSEKVNRKMFAQNYNYGGYKMPPFDILIQASKIKWISMFLDGNDKDWKITFESLAQINRLDICLQSNFDYKEFAPNLPDYYQDTVKFWYTLKEGLQDYQSRLSSQMIWYNRHCKANGKSMFNKSLFEIGIWTAQDLYDKDRLIPFEIWTRRGAQNNDFMAWRSLVSSIPYEMKPSNDDENEGKISFPNLGDQNPVIPIFKLTVKYIKNHIIKKQYDILQKGKIKSQEKIKAIHGYLNEESWKHVYVLPHLVMKNNKIKELQYKILFRYIGTNKLLHRINKIDSPRCSFCAMYIESIEHLFYECFVVKDFWLKVCELWNRQMVQTMQLACKEVIMGYCPQDITDNVIFAINLVLLYGKKYIYTCKFYEKAIDVTAFVEYVKACLKIENYDMAVTTLLNRALF